MAGYTLHDRKNVDVRQEGDDDENSVTLFYDKLRDRFSIKLITSDKFSNNYLHNIVICTITHVI